MLRQGGGMAAKTQYAKSGDVHIAYQVVGHGNLDLVVVPGFVSHVEYIWEEPRAARFLNGLTDFARLILFDKRGKDEFPVVESKIGWFPACPCP